VKENVTLPVLKKVSALQVVKKRKEKEIAENIIKDLRIATPSIHQRVKNLSGGNKQKVSLGKWLTSENDIFIFNEPTVGIDVGSKTEIYKIIESIADKDKGVLIVSFNLPEILGLADRIIVMREGRIVGEVEKQDADENKILRMAYGLD
jgi:ABC-type sugar transport system ATPase subunit